MDKSASWWFVNKVLCMNQKMSSLCPAFKFSSMYVRIFRWIYLSWRTKDRQCLKLLIQNIEMSTALLIIPQNSWCKIFSHLDLDPLIIFTGWTNIFNLKRSIIECLAEAALCRSYWIASSYSNNVWSMEIEEFLWTTVLKW